MKRIDDAAADRVARFLGAALPAARANASWPNLRVLGGFAALFAPSVHGGLGAPLAIDEGTGLAGYESWARLAADHTVACSEGGATDDVLVLAARAPSSPVHATRYARRRYHDALRGLPALRLGELDVAVRKDEAKGARSVHAILDKIEADGQLVRLTVDVTLQKSVTDKRLRDLLFSLTSQAVELVLVQLLEERGVTAVERVSRGAVDACCVVDAGVVPGVLESVAALPGAAVCAFSFTTCALDVSAGNNDPFPRAQHDLGQLPHRVFADRKLVLTAPAEGAIARVIEQKRTHTMVYRVESA